MRIMLDEKHMCMLADFEDHFEDHCNGGWELEAFNMSIEH